MSYVSPPQLNSGPLNSGHLGYAPPAMGAYQQPGMMPGRPNWGPTGSSPVGTGSYGPGLSHLGPGGLPNPYNSIPSPAPTSFESMRTPNTNPSIPSYENMSAPGTQPYDSMVVAPTYDSMVAYPPNFPAAESMIAYPGYHAQHRAMLSAETYKGRVSGQPSPTSKVAKKKIGCCGTTTTTTEDGKVTKRKGKSCC